MLSLTSTRWAELKSHFGAGSDVPPLISAWKECLGTADEEARYENLFEHYLHQLTILSCAYAVVPHVASALGQTNPSRRLEYLSDIARVEMSRVPRAEVDRRVAQIRSSPEIPDGLRDHFANVTRDRLPELPADLAHDYLETLAVARTAAVELLDEPWNSVDTSRLLGTITGLFYPREDNLAGALLNPEGLSIPMEYEDKASISVLLSDYQKAPASTEPD